MNQSKICHGPYHPPGGSLVSLSEFTYNQSGRRKGKPLSRCKKCRSLGNAKTIPSSVYLPLIETLLNNRNIAEVSNLVNLSEHHVRELSQGKRQRIYKKTFLNIFRAVSNLPKEKTSIGPQNIKTKRNGKAKLTYEERLNLRKLVSKEQKKRYKIEKSLLRHVV